MPRPRITSPAVLLALLVTASVPPLAAGNEAPRTHVKTLKVTVLSTMLADAGFGEWGFAALVEADGHRGLVVITGCGHAGIVNILAHAHGAFPDAPVHAVLGGLHLFPAYRLRERLNLSRKTAVVGAVGSTFSLSDGIAPGNIAR